VALRSGIEVFSLEFWFKLIGLLELFGK